MLEALVTPEGEKKSMQNGSIRGEKNILVNQE